MKHHSLPKVLLDESIELLCELIAIPSVSGNEGALVTYLCHVLDAWGWRYECHDTIAGRPIIFITFGEPKVVYSTHTDVAPGSDVLFTPRFDGKSVRGRGACDAKGIIVAMIAAARLLISEGHTDFGVLLVPGKELDGVGARVASSALKNRGILHFINGAPTEGSLMKGQKGLLKLLLKAQGGASHSTSLGGVMMRTVDW